MTVGDAAPALADADIVDDVDRHLSAAGDMERAALLPGMYLAWCVRLQLVNEDFVRDHAPAVLRLNYGDCTGSEVFIAACGGTLRFAHLNQAGAAFTRRYYANYLNDWRATFGDDLYAVEDSWQNYQRIAALLTRALKGAPDTETSSASRRWWQFWR